MELAAIIATALVVVLQIITIALVVGNRKNVRDQVGKASPALSNDKSEDRKERDFRIQNRRPAQDQRPKPPTQQPVNTGSVETVEKSLRDINLKLKNAERDQEFARRKVQENFPKDSNRRPSGNDRNIGNENPSGYRAWSLAMVGAVEIAVIEMVAKVETEMVAKEMVAIGKIVTEILVMVDMTVIVLAVAVVTGRNVIKQENQ